MRTFLSIIYGFLLLVGSYACNEPEVLEIEKGFIKNNRYYNNALQWSFPLLNDWEIHSDLGTEEGVYSKLNLGSDPDKIDVLLNREIDQFNNGSISFDINKYDGINSAKEYIGITNEFFKKFIEKLKNKESLKSIGFDYEIIDFDYEIDGKNFEGYEVYVKNIKKELYTLMLVSKLKGGYITIEFTTDKEERKEKFLKNLKASVFSNIIFPENTSKMPDSLLIDSLPSIFKQNVERFFELKNDNNFTGLSSYFHPALFREYSKGFPTETKEDFAKKMVSLSYVNDYRIIEDSIAELHTVYLPDKYVNYNSYYCSIINYDLSVVNTISKDTLVEKISSSVIGLYSKGDNRCFLLANNLMTFEQISNDIPRHILRKIIKEKDYQESKDLDLSFLEEILE